MDRKPAAGAKCPWTVYPSTDRKGVVWAYVNIRIKGFPRVRESLGISNYDERRAGDVRQAQEKARARYTELVAGRVLDKGDRIRTTETLAELLAGWIHESTKLYPSSVEAREVYQATFNEWAGGDRALRRTGSLEKIVADNGPKQFAMHRLKFVMRGTVTKEVSALFRFLIWCVDNDKLASLPPRPELPDGLVGTSSGTQRKKAVPISEEEAHKILARLPEWIAKGGNKQTDRSKVKGAFPCRDRFVFAYATSLRPATLSGLSVPEHWSPEMGKTLNITDDIDKERYGRVVPLSDEAYEVLLRHAPKEGLIFGEHDYRGPIKKAAAQVLDAKRAEDFSDYDFRHAAITHTIDASQDLLAVQFMAGHKQLSTTSRYTHANAAHLRRAFDLRRKASRSSRLVSQRSVSLCEGGDLNPYGSYPASTSTQRIQRNPEKNGKQVRQATSKNAGKTSADVTDRSVKSQSPSGGVAMLESLRAALDVAIAAGKFDAVASISAAIAKLSD